MNRILQANIGGQVFPMEEPAYRKLDRYLNHIRRKQGADGSEIIADMEQRIAELLTDELGNKAFVSLPMVDRVIQTMGQPEDFDTDERRTYEAASDRGFPGFTRDTSNKILAGVCAGIGNRFDIDPLWVRLAFVVSVLLGGAGFLIYLILWILVPASGKKKAAEPVNHVNYAVK